MGPLLAGPFLLLTFATAGLAQTTDGSIRGYVRDEQRGVLPGVTITATSPTVATPYVAVSDQDGYYRVLNLPPGDYTVVAELTGFSKFARSNVVVRAGLNVGLDVDMRIGTLEETVQVVGETPLIDTTKAVQAVNVSGEMQRELPLGSQKHFSEFLRLTPGAVSRDATVNQAPVFYVHGSGIVSSSTLIDGADMTSAVNPWLGYAALPEDTIADVQLQTSGLDASVPLGMGLAANVVTKSGTNSFSGSGTFTFAPKDWIDNNTPGGTSESASLMQPEASIGGPLMRDRWWFFASYRYRSGTFGIGRQVDQVADMQALVPTFEPFDRDIGANIFFTKMTGQINQDHQISGFLNKDATPYDSDGSFDTDKFIRTTIGGWGFSSRLTSNWTAWLSSRVAFSWNNKGATTTLNRTDLTSRQVYRSAFLSSGRLMGSTQLATLDNRPSATGSPYSKWTVTADLTAYRTGWGGSHEFQFGVFLQPRMHRLDEIVIANGGFAQEDHMLRDPNNPAGGTIPFHRIVYDAAEGTLAEGHFSDNAFYIQDAWRPTPRLTINAGFRIDHVTREDDLFEMELQNSFEVGPRLGVNYVLTEDQRNAVRASYMRLADAPNINAQSASGAGTQGSGAQTIAFRDLYDLDLNGTFETVFATPAASPVSPNRIIDPDYHQPFVDEWALGYRRQLPGQMSVDVGFLRRDYKHRTALVEQNAIYDGNVFRGYRDESLNEIYLLTPNVWNTPVYKAIELVGTKRTNLFQVVASYTKVWSHLDGTWQPNDPASYLQPAAFPYERGLPSNDNRSASANDSYTATATTGSIEWMENVARIAVVYRAPWDFMLSTSYSWQKGRWSGAILDRIAAPDPQFGPPTVTLSNGRVVSNPLATTIRFAHPTRSDGQFELPGLHQFNLRVGRDFRLGGDRRIGISFDLFNVPNAGKYQGFLSGANQLYSTNYGRGGEVQPPRSAQFALRYLF